MVVPLCYFITIAGFIYPGNQSISANALHKKSSFPLRTSSINVSKYAENCEFGCIY